MRRVSTTHFGVLGGALLLVALVLALALPGVASAGKSRPADVAPPITTDNSADANGGAFTLVLSPVDRSGVAATLYSVDGGIWVSGSEVMLRQARLHKGGGLVLGLHTVEYFSVDSLNNQESIKSCTITL